MPKERPERDFIREPRASDERLDDFSRELNNGIPLAPPVGYTKRPSMIEIVRQQIRSEHLRLQALQADMETFDEADDFEVDDDYDPKTPFEEVFDPVDYEVRQRLRNEEYAASVEARLAEAKEKRDGSKPNSDKGRMVDDSGRSGEPIEERPVEPAAREKPAVKGSVRPGKADN